MSGSIPVAQPAATATRPTRLLAVVLGFLGLSVAVHAVALSYVFSVDTDLDRSDYYEAGERHDAELAKQAAGVAFTTEITPGQGFVAAQVRADAVPAGTVARLVLQRPDDAMADASFRASTDGQGTLRFETPGLREGRWRLRLELDSQPPAARSAYLHVFADGRGELR
ncbi:MAG: FixH [Pseudomonadota bacterium]